LNKSPTIIAPRNTFTIERAYYYHRGKGQGHCPADASLGLEKAYSPALARVLCLEGADESSFLKASQHLREVGGMEIDERQIQRVIQRVGPAVLDWNDFWKYRRNQLA